MICGREGQGSGGEEGDGLVGTLLAPGPLLPLDLQYSAGVKEAGRRQGGARGWVREEGQGLVAGTRAPRCCAYARWQG